MVTWIPDTGLDGTPDTAPDGVLVGCCHSPQVAAAIEPKDDEHVEDVAPPRSLAIGDSARMRLEPMPSRQHEAAAGRRPADLVPHGRSLLTILTINIGNLSSSTHVVASHSTSIMHSNSSSAHGEYVHELVSLLQVRTASERHADGVCWVAGW